MVSSESSAVERTLGQLLYRDHWTPEPVAPLALTFRALGMSELDLHLLLFELQMSHGAVYPADCVALDDTLHYLVVLTAVLSPLPTH
ncbi:hypothetical protein LJ737_24555 [Hymenobacter sp. 15J16-1T3B]|uniref:hypothetical protein n=1 Tax=Hymenobacter sp. 15J16-1T3B TaxID=2886941 RepID=UPI001D1191FD|nr:hypothetical protein [Hymenobacter sp. 15J16-1T3B]MCC3160431.1 hypothetical protein [Hymenobacter sp. 15J16-1T3B]